ncbi:efflux transporter outer membrane subunit [Croceicoccus hydrothermalis]|uniref:efflux transporter outer membrane subunit n=1 Tax=Croceicoccus hydrothermalis TaxID=2867964 RepID=UPI001EFC2C8E|nr:efflux transporter outer membrane subunit [Croceicoccus hydrothermalis]
MKRLRSPTASLRVGATIAVSALLGACAPGATPPPTLSQVVAQPPDSFLAAAPDQSAQIDERWWLRFGDPLLARYVERAVESSPAVLQAIARMEQAGAAARIARADLFPQISAGLDASRSRQNLAGSGFGAILGGADGGNDGDGDDSPTSFVNDSFQLTGRVSWDIDLWGRISAQSAAARAEYFASRENLRAARQSIAAEVVRNYFNVVTANQQVAVSSELVDAIAEVARQVNNRAKVGIAPPNDRTLAIANLGQARAGLAQQREGLVRVTRGFDQLIRAYPDGEVATASALPAVPPAPPAGLPADLLLRRPDIRAAEWQLRAAGFRLDAARRSFLPGISLTGNAGTSSSALENLLDGEFFVWTIAGSVLQPIFQGGRLRAQLAQADGVQAEAVAAYTETVLQALTEVETALAADQQLLARQEALEVAAEAARASVEISFNRYRAGLDPFVTVLESQQSALDANAAYLDAVSARLDNRVTLHQALGGGFGDMPPAVQAPAISQD